MNIISKKCACMATAAMIGTTAFFGANPVAAMFGINTDKEITKAASSEAVGGKYNTNGTGLGQQKTINSFSDWTEDMIIAQGVANDDPRIFRGAHEGPVYDTYALYGAWDDTNIYLMWQFVNVTDVTAPDQDYPQSDNGKPYNGDIPQIIALSVDPTKNANGLDDGTNIWGIRVDYETNVDNLLYFSSKPGVGQPAIFSAGDDGTFSYDTCITFKDAGVSYSYKDGFLGSTMTGIKANGWSGYTPDDLYSSSSNWVNFLNEGHDTKHDTMYQMTVPLSSLGIDKDYIEKNGIGVMHISTFGQSGIGSLPHDKSMLDAATDPYGPDESTSAEKEDFDTVSVPLARLGAAVDEEQVVINSLNASKNSPQLIGSSIDFTTDASGGEGTLSYKYEINSKVLRDFSTSNKFTWAPTEAGDYEVKVTVKDSNGKTATKTINYSITEDESKKASITNIEVSKSTGVVGEALDITTIAEGTGELYYRVSVHEISQGWIVLNDYSTSNILSWTPNKAGKYKIWVDLKDSKGNKVSKLIDYSVK